MMILEEGCVLPMGSVVMKVIGLACLIYFLFILFSDADIEGWITAFVGLLSWSLYLMARYMDKKQSTNQ